MIKLNNVCAGYGNGDILHNISLSFEKGKITSIIGINGCGKSTLLKTLVRIISQSSGEITVDGAPLLSFSQSELAKKIAYLPQNKSAPDMTVLRMVLHGRFPHLAYPRRYREEDIRIAEQALCDMGISDLRDEYMTSLSGGQRQKAYIAMALAQQSPVILMDEPTTYLDISHRLKLAATIKELAESGKTIVLVLHDLSLALKLSDFICVLNGGRVADFGTPSEILGSGSIENVFNVSITSADTPDGVQYFYKL